MLDIGTPAPALDLPRLGGGRVKLSEQSPEKFTMLVVYRGRHCPVCKTYLQTLRDHLDRYRALGVEPIAVSCDSEERATKSRDAWDVGALTIGYDLSIESARAWGLYVSEAIKDAEPRRFSEPGLFLLRPDGTVFYVAINSMPFGRPDIATFHEKIEWIIDNDYPARGQG